MKKFIPLLVTAAIGLGGCSNDQAEQQASSTDSQPPKVETAAADPHAGLQSQPAADPHAGVNMQQAASAPRMAPSMSGNGRGVVKSVTQAAGYSYVELESSGKPLWIAVSLTDVKPGDEVAWRDGAVMNNFTSKSLGRTFPEIMFVSSFMPAGAAAAVPLSEGVVVSAKESAGYSYVELDTEHGKTWLALPKVALDNGSRVRWNGGSEMKNFYSKSLDTTFPSIWFISSLDVVK